MGGVVTMYMLTWINWFYFTKYDKNCMVSLLVNHFFTLSFHNVIKGALCCGWNCYYISYFLNHTYFQHFVINPSGFAAGDGVWTQPEWNQHCLRRLWRACRGHHSNQHHQRYDYQNWPASSTGFALLIVLQSTGPVCSAHEVLVGVP